MSSIGKIKEIKRVAQTRRVPTFKTNKNHSIVNPKKYKVHGDLYDVWFSEEEKKELEISKPQK